MGRVRRRGRLPGHYCRVCDCRRPNERFSGKGHARHICRECERLGSVELDYRQARRDLENCLDWEGIIPRKRRRQFARFLAHSDLRIRARAEQMQRDDWLERTRRRLVALNDYDALQVLDSAVIAWELSASREEGTEWWSEIFEEIRAGANDLDAPYP